MLNNEKINLNTFWFSITTYVYAKGTTHDECYISGTSEIKRKTLKHNYLFSVIQIKIRQSDSSTQENNERDFSVSISGINFTKYNFPNEEENTGYKSRLRYDFIEKG